MKHEGSPDGREILPNLSLGPVELERLARYEVLLLEVAIPKGIISSADRARLFERHVADALRAVPLVGSADEMIDLGSGSGIPGVPIAVALPRNRIILAETRRSRVSFLELVRDSLPLPNCEVFHGRAETAVGPFDVCLARAFAPPMTSWQIASRLLKPAGRLLYWGGSGFDPSQVPEDVSVELVATSALANAGPIVIMTRQ